MTIAVISMIRDAWGGSEELWYRMAREAIGQGHRIVHLSYEAPHRHRKLQELIDMGMIQLDRPGWIPPAAGRAKRLGYLGYNFTRRKLLSPFKKLEKFHPDIILYNGTCYSIAAEKELLNLVKRLPVPFFILGQLNGEAVRPIGDREASIVREGYARCKNVFFVSQRNLDTARRHLCDPIAHAVIVRNPVNMKDTGIMEWPAAKGPLQMAVVANLVTVHKGQDILLEALAQWEERDWILNIYGSGYDEFYLKRLAQFRELEEKVIFHGAVQDIRSVWEKNALMIMPSHMEGMPLAVVEAMLCGRVCIATDVGGHTEWIRHGENGFIAAAPSIPCLLQALREAFARRSQWPAIGAEAHRTASGLYDPHAGASLLRRIIAP